MTAGTGYLLLHQINKNAVVRMEVTTKTTKTGLDGAARSLEAKRCKRLLPMPLAIKADLALVDNKKHPARGQQHPGDSLVDSDPCAVLTQNAQRRDRQRRRGPAEDDQPHQLPPRPGRRRPVPRPRRLARPRAVSSDASPSPCYYFNTLMLWLGSFGFLARRSD